MTITARMLTQDKDGIGGYMAHPDGAGQRPGVLMAHHAHGVTADYKIDAYRLALLGYNVLAPSPFNMFGALGLRRSRLAARDRLPAAQGLTGLGAAATARTPRRRCRAATS